MDALVVMSREEAGSLGLMRYLPGERCKHGHLEPRRVSTNQCCECQRLSHLGLLPKRVKSLKPAHLVNNGFTHDPTYWPDDGGSKRVAIYDHNQRPPRLVRRVGWTNCLGREPVHRIFSSDVARERICTSCKGRQTRGTIDD